MAILAYRDRFHKLQTHTTWLQWTEKIILVFIFLLITELATLSLGKVRRNLLDVLGEKDEMHIAAAPLSDAMLEQAALSMVSMIA